MFEITPTDVGFTVGDKVFTPSGFAYVLDETVSDDEIQVCLIRNSNNALFSEDEIEHVTNEEFPSAVPAQSIKWKYR